MKKNLLLSLFVILAAAKVSIGQNVDYNKIILPTNATNVDIEERLVQLAWKNHPSNRAVENEVLAAKYSINKAKSEWLDIIRIQGNINEFNINPQHNPDGTLQPSFFPRYNFGAYLSLGTLVRVPAEVKRTRTMAKIAENNLDEQKLHLRQAVLQAYNTYLKFQQILKIRSKALEDATNAHTLTEQKFRQGDESFDRYTTSSTALDQIRIFKIEAETEFLNSKLELEQMIGVKLEEVIN